MTAMDFGRSYAASKYSMALAKPFTTNCNALDGSTDVLVSFLIAIIYSKKKAQIMLRRERLYKYILESELLKAPNELAIVLISTCFKCKAFD